MKFFVLGSVVSATVFTSTLFNPTDDPCQRICDEYSADRRGAGFDLCDSENQSRCIQIGERDFCSNLYWSTTTDGVRGYVYSDNNTDLTPEEQSTPVTCMDAVRDVMEDFDYFHNGVTDYANLQPIVATIQDATEGIFFDIRQYIEGSADGTLRYSTFARLFSQMGEGMRSLRS